MASIARRLFSAIRSPAPTTTTPTPMDREEKGYPPESEGSNTMTKSVVDRRTTLRSIDPSELIPTDDRLLTFRTLTGIDTVPAVNREGNSPRSAANIGIYTRVVREERKAKKSYRVISLSIHFSLTLQIVIGAAITAVAASNGSNRAITALGALNTIFAGALAYVKGSGYPESLKHHELEWKKIREYIEQRERELCLFESNLDVNYEVRVVEEMYQRTKKELKLGRGDVKEVKHDNSEKSTETSERRASVDLRRPTSPPAVATSSTAQVKETRP